ncbi:MAG: hypothetical protein GY856_43580 [bacterium]|nr:hypothetical protein [bacterium]
MRANGTLNATWPLCGCEMVIDAPTGEVLIHKAAKQPLAGGKDFDSLLAGIDESKSHADEVFQREVSALKDRDRLLEEKFREAMKRAEEEPDDGPPIRPWDLD